MLKKKKFLYTYHISFVHPYSFSSIYHDVTTAFFSIYTFCCWLWRHVSCDVALQTKKVEEARSVYERVVTQFPNAGRYWKLYIEHEVTILYLHVSRDWHSSGGQCTTLDIGFPTFENNILVFIFKKANDFCVQFTHFCLGFRVVEIGYAYLINKLFEHLLGYIIFWNISEPRTFLRNKSSFRNICRKL